MSNNPKKSPQYYITRFENQSFRFVRHRIVGSMEIRGGVRFMETACGLNALNLADQGGCGVTAWHETTCPYCLEVRREHESRGIKK